MFTVGGRGDNVCAICSSSRPCDHCFLCFECCERFRAEAGDICNGCREESSIERVRFVNDRTTERHMLAAAAAVEDETLLESQPTPRSLNLDALTQGPKEGEKYPGARPPGPRPSGRTRACPSAPTSRAARTIRGP